MKKAILNAVFTALCTVSAPTLFAADPETPIIEFHTNIYETYGATNAFHIVIGAKEDTYVDVDCGFGTFETMVGEAIFDPDSQGIQATAISCTVTEEGIVRIYGDASKIDYLDCQGCYIDRISFPTLTEIQILDLSHNELKSLDLTHMNKLESLTITDNPFDEKPLLIGGNKPNLTILEMSIVGHLDSSFNLSDYPAMASFEAYHCDELYTLDPSGCPDLLRLSVDVTPLSSLDVSKNTSLLILNISDTYITSIDLSHNPYLTEFYCGHAGSFAPSYKIKELDVSKNPLLQRFYCQYNDLTTLDISKNTALVSFSCESNNLPGIDFSNNPDLANVSVKNNNMDFNTIPLPRATMTEYYYTQKPLAVNRSYVAGSVIDLTSRVIRPGSATDAVVYSVNEEAGSDELLDPESYIWDNGKITIKEEHADSLYVAFKNELFPEAILTTERFMVKSAENFGKPVPAISLRVSAQSKNLSFCIGLDGASAETPKSFMVDFGDGELQEFTATTSALPATPNVAGTRKGANIVVYMPEGQHATAFSANSIRILGSDFSQAPTLRELKLNNCTLSTIDLKWNRCLTMLDMSYNNLGKIDLSGVNGNYGKNVLANINLSDNLLTELILNDAPTIVDLNLADNMLQAISLERFSNLKSLNISSNALSEIDLSDCEKLEALDISFNSFETITIPETCPINRLNIAGNKLYFSALPLPGTYSEYTYAPQAEILLPEKAPVADLRALEYEGKTVYTWYHADGTPASDNDVISNNGSFRFSSGDAGLFYCTMSNSIFPDFTGENAYRTSVIEAADMPTVSFLEFTTTENSEASISLTGEADNTTVYIDWSGDGNLTQYILKKNYTVFPVTTKAGVTVKAYAYDDNNGVTMCSISGVKMSNLDASELRQATAFFVYGSGLTDNSFSLPENSGLLELGITGTGITRIDLSAYTSLKHLNLSENRLKSFDLGILPNIETFHANGNGMNEIRLANPALWELGLNNNEFDNIDLSGAPAITQLWLTGNKLESLDIDFLQSLRVISISENNFTFATLPPVKSSYYIYDYGKQTPLDITVSADNKVDLSSQADANGIKTVYTWYIDSPYYDDYGELTGESLIEGEEYTIENGVTTFLANFHNIMCVMTNTAFPNLALYTNFIDVTGVSGIGSVGTSGDTTVRAEGSSIVVDTTDGTPVALYTIGGARIGTADGSTVFPGLSAGVYIVTAGRDAFKVAVH